MSVRSDRHSNKSNSLSQVIFHSNHSSKEYLQTLAQEILQEEEEDLVPFYPTVQHSFLVANPTKLETSMRRLSSARRRSLMPTDPFMSSLDRSKLLSSFF
jgi:hypothetical protein